MKYRADIDGLRAVAVLPVVLYHTGLGNFSGGFVGVDIFFVISGFLITGIIAKEIDQNRFSLVSFYERRIRRIFPALFFMLFATACVSAYVLLPSDLIDFGRSLISTIFFVSNVYFSAKSGYFDGPSELKPLLHTWSLAVEEQFYLFFPLFLIALHRWGGTRKGPWILGAAALSFAASVAGLIYMPVFTFYGAPFRAWELLMGSAIALGFVPVCKSRLISELLGIAGLALIGYAVFGYSLTTPFPGAAAFVPCLGAALLIYTGKDDTLAARLLSTKPFVAVGMISYSLYLWHWPVIVLYRQMMSGEVGLADELVIIALSFALAVLSWQFVEKPFRGSGSAVRQKTLFFGAGAVTAGLLVLGIVPDLTKGLSIRFPAYSQLRAELERNENVLKDMDGRPCDDPTLKRFGIDRDITSYCSHFGDPNASRNIVLWGDSHAHAWLPVFVRAARDLNLRGTVISVGGCPPILGVKRTDPGAVKQHCASRETNDAIFDFIRAEKPEQVFLVARWGLYANGWIRNGRLFRWTSFLVQNDQPEATRETSRAALQDKLPATVAALSAFTHVRVVRSVPALKLGATELALLPADKQRRYLPTAVEYESEEQFINGIIESLVRSGLVLELDPRGLLCTDRCEFTQNGELLYFDDNHLSAIGALRYLDQVKGLLNGGRGALH